MDIEEILRIQRRIDPRAIMVDLGVNAQGERELLKSPRPGESVCDFCSDVPVVAAFSAGTIRIDLPGDLPAVGSSDEWATCATCELLVRTKDKVALAARAAEKISANIGIPLESARDSVNMIHERFWKARE